jgi:hypothetical protein
MSAVSSLKAIPCLALMFAALFWPSASEALKPPEPWPPILCPKTPSRGCTDHGYVYFQDSGVKCVVNRDGLELCSSKPVVPGCTEHSDNEACFMNSRTGKRSVYVFTPHEWDEHPMGVTSDWDYFVSLAPVLIGFGLIAVLASMFTRRRNRKRRQSQENDLS